MRATFKVSFIIQKGKPKSDGKVPIMARICLNGKMSHFSTQLSVLPTIWLPKMGKTIGSTKAEKDMNRLLDDISVNVKARYFDLLTRGEPINADKLKNYTFSLDDKSMTLGELCDKFIEDYYQLVLSKDVTRTTYQRYVLTKNRLIEFTKEKYKKSDILLSDLCPDYIKKFDLWVRVKHNCANNTAARFIRHFRTVYNMALDNDWIRSDPFKKYHVHLEKINRAYLTQEELNKLRTKHLDNKRLAIVRDMFVFSCYTGFAYIDVLQLTKENLNYINGRMWVTTFRQKTNTPVNILLLDVPQQILLRYEGQGINDRLLPLPSNQKANDYLKEIAAICGIEKNLTFHMARHTFATTVTLGNGVPMETVSKMLGHTSIKTTQIYARITDTKINNDMEILAQKLGMSSTLQSGVAI